MQNYVNTNQAIVVIQLIFRGFILYEDSYTEAQITKIIHPRLCREIYALMASDSGRTVIVPILKGRSFSLSIIKPGKGLIKKLHRFPLIRKST
jgi:hypothetical protein